MHPHDARQIANFLLDNADELSMPLTHLSLQKILYFAHGWHYAYYDKPLIKNGFEAWQYGPVVRIVYENFKKFGDKPIKGTRATAFNAIKNQKHVCEYNFITGQKDFLRSILLEYGPINAHQLVHLSHIEGSPWHKIWHRPKDQDAAGLIISEQLIEEYFKSALGMKSYIN